MAHRALILANGRFDDGAIPDLQSPVPDGEALAALLARADIGAYEVTVVADQPTSVVRLATQRFFAEAGPDDLLILYLSGHGMKDRRGNLHFVTKDTVRDALAATAIEARFFHDRMRDSPAARQVVFVDTCYSGAFAEGGSFKSVDIAVDRADFTGSLAEEADEDEGIAIYTASSGNQVAQEKAAEDVGAHQSVFTRHLIEGIATGAADPKQTGWITLESLFRHIRQQLKREGAGQTPQRLLARLPGTVKLAKNPVAQVELPDAVRAALEGNDRMARLAVVDDLLALAQGDAVLMADKARAALQVLALDESASVAAAAERALARLGPADAVEDAAIAARRAEEEARLKAEAEALARQRAELEAREREAAEAAELARRDEERRPPREPEQPPAKKSGTGRIVAVAAVVLVGLGIVGAMVEGIDSGRVSTEDFGVDDGVSVTPGPPMPMIVEPPAEAGHGRADAPADMRAVIENMGDGASSAAAKPADPPDPAAEMARRVAAQMQPLLPQMVQPGLVMTEAIATGRTLAFVVQSNEFLAAEAVPLIKPMLQQMAQQSCTDPLTFEFVRAGGTLTYRFAALNGVSFDVSVASC